ncbi:MAG TPA: peptide-methionine (S)-S-oxide reductase MsrA [Luteibacter sp.]|jgi:peptide-methionine (S)-S-oxide reductase|nr:peptide-methionine (S)-S-oxide reductase MsrA [Luteibacter sp.]
MFRGPYLSVSLALLVGLAACAPVFAGEGVKLPDPALDPAAAAGDQVAVLAGGCFWGVEGVFEHVKGVKKVLAGYSGGQARTANYDDVSDGDTGHAESVQITYDPAQVSYGQLLKIYFSVALDPTLVDRQGPDRGKQYRSAIFYATPAQKQVANAYVAQLTAAKAFDAPIATQLVPLDKFYPAEGYHQNYMRLHPDAAYIVYNDAPKVAALKRIYPGVYQPWAGEP